MTSMTQELSESSVADVAVQYPHALPIFYKYNIDFCCGGKRSFRETCEKKGLNADTIWNEIVHSKSGENSNLMRFNSWDSPFLVDFIIQNHHAYVKEAIPQLQELLDKVCSVHGEDHIELPEIRDDFNDLADELQTHMNKEEMFLFPAIKNRAQREIYYVPLDGPISVMEDEHEIAGDLMKSIRQLAKHYTIPRDACPTLQLTYKKLEEFDHDLMQHVHLENNVLFERLKTLV
ncbi:MAG TPA: iron-sulfur cluster repair di-iron protein [Cyclobacteriaceae bacterium]